MAQLAPATALPGLLAFAGLAALGHVTDLRLVGLMSLARVTAGVGGSLLGEGPALGVIYAITHDRGNQVAEYRKAVLVMAAVTVPPAVVVGCLIGLWRWDLGGPLALGALLAVPEALFTFEFGVLRAERRFNRASVLASFRSLVSWTAAVTVASTTSSLAAVGAAYLAGLVVVGVVVQQPVRPV